MRNRRILVAGLTAVTMTAGAAGCGSATQDGSSDSVSVVATTTMLADITARVVECGGGTVQGLIPVGADPHDVSPSSRDVADMVAADLVVANGLSLEEGLAAALEAVREDGGTVLEVAPLLDPLPFGGGKTIEVFAGGDAADHAEEHHAEDHHDGDTGEGDDPHAEDHHDGDTGDDHFGSDDPHVWMDVERMSRAADRIGAEVARMTGDETFTECGSQVAEDLRGIDEEVRQILESVPDERRILVTDHDALGYFADAYDFAIAGVVIPGGSTLGEPSSAQLAQLAEVVQAAGVSAVFAGTAANSALVDTLAAEVGEDIDVVELYVGSLGEEGSPADTYEGMMLTDARRIADALRG